MCQRQAHFDAANDALVTTMIVRFITRRFIGEYDPNVEKVYNFSALIDNETIWFEILDAAGKFNEESATLETNIRWADAFILMYSVTDKCSFDECNRLKFLINYNKRRKRSGSNSKDGIYDVPVILVANKIDQGGDRMVTRDEGQRRFREISCACFHEISVRESVDQVLAVFRDVYRFYRVSTKFPKLKRSSSDVQNGFYSSILSPDSICSLFDSAFRIEKRRSFLIGHVWNEPSPEENDEHRKENDSLETTKNGKLPFRERASTDGTIFSRPKRWKYPTHGTSTTSHQVCGQRRMSISMRGSKASY